MAQDTKKEWPRTISEELHDAWKRLRRRGDPETMAAELKYSRPVIDRALIYGYVSLQELPDKINGYFMARLNRERESAKELNNAQDELTQKS
jgi:hypothetical protein